ncbi:hypothetical protein RJT34_01866 [Clitoria ternatea]|uniref:RNase H type-1 domain-containing protein n=1 Tax=Clitoria ternatea TaxID=43366 RepID=A0AAN9Q3J8_CLITE
MMDHENRRWDLFKNFLPTVVNETFLSIMPPTEDATSDYRVWFGDKSRIFSRWKRNMVVQFDMVVVYQQVTKGFEGNIQSRNLMQNIRKILRQFEHVEFKQIFREANHVADLLANNACNQDDVLRILDDPPSPSSNVVELLKDDVICKSWDRIICALFLIICV